MSLENITPYRNSGQDKKHQVAKMFNNIAWRYDFLNHFLSLGVDRYWRKKAILALKKSKPLLMLDIATGTADLAIEAMRLNPVKVFGIDISSDMLELGREKIRNKKLQDKIELLEGDSENMIFEDNKFDAITVGFGVRNFQNLEKGLNEMHRVLNKNGKLVILEFSQPTNKMFLRLYDFYSSVIAPKIGSMISKDKSAYTYLHDSVKSFPYGEQFCQILAKSGFNKIGFRPLTFGIATIYVAEKSS